VIKLSSHFPQSGNGDDVQLYRADDIEAGRWAFITVISTPKTWHDGIVFSEDPFLWIDARGMWHLLTHKYDLKNGWPPQVGHDGPVMVSGHGWSRDGLHWSFQENQPYYGKILYEDASVQYLSTMERPHLLFDANKEPIYLINGISTHWAGPDGNPCSDCSGPRGFHQCIGCKVTPGMDHTVTLMTPIVH